MGKVEEVDRLVAEFKKLDGVYQACRDLIRENAEQRTGILKELCTYVTQRDAGMLVGMCESNVSRIVRGKHLK